MQLVPFCSGELRGQGAEYPLTAPCLSAADEAGSLRGGGTGSGAIAMAEEYSPSLCHSVYNKNSRDRILMHHAPSRLVERTGTETARPGRSFCSFSYK